MVLLLFLLLITSDVGVDDVDDFQNINKLCD